MASTNISKISVAIDKLINDLFKNEMPEGDDKAMGIGLLPLSSIEGLATQKQNRSKARQFFDRINVFKNLFIQEPITQVNLEDE